MASTSHTQYSPASSSTSPPAPEPISHDYTEGASGIDIDAAVASRQISRRDSQLSLPYAYSGEAGGGGTMFDGPGPEVHPSSVSRMSYGGEKGLAERRSSEWRRRSMDSRDGRSRSWSRRRNSVDDRGEDEDDHTDIEESGGRSINSRRRRKRSVSPPPAARSSVFGNLTSLFTTRNASAQAQDSPPHSRRPSLSRHRSSGSIPGRRPRRNNRVSSDAGSDYAVETDEEAQERWGYSSGEEDFSDAEEDDNEGRRHLRPGEEDVDSIDRMSLNYDSSYPPSPGPSLPLLSSDPIFGGETRIDMDGVLESFDDDPPPLGPPSRQTIYIADEDTTIRLIGYETIYWKILVWRFGSIISLGLLGLLGHWFPRLWLRWIAHEKAFKDTNEGFIVVEVGNFLHVPLINVTKRGPFSDDS